MGTRIWWRIRREDIHQNGQDWDVCVVIISLTRTDYVLSVSMHAKSIYNERSDISQGKLCVQVGL